MTRGNRRSFFCLISILTETVFNEGHAIGRHDLNGFKARGADQFRLITGDCAAGFDKNFTCTITAFWIDNVIRSCFALKLRNTAASSNLFNFSLIEKL